MEKSVVLRLIEAAKVANVDKYPGWALEVRTFGIRIKHTWVAANGQSYMVESNTGWKAIVSAPKNPLLTAMENLLKQVSEFNS